MIAVTTSEIRCRLIGRHSTIVVLWSIRTSSFGGDNDKIVYDANALSSSAWRRFLRAKLPHAQRGYKSYPSVNLGRLGVHRECAGTGVGTEILDFVKMSFVTNNKTGCRFVTVDAYNTPTTIRFYEKNGFRFFPSHQSDAGQRTRLMYFDLRPFRDALEGAGI